VEFVSNNGVDNLGTSRRAEVVEKTTPYFTFK